MTDLPNPIPGIYPAAVLAVMAIGSQKLTAFVVAAANYVEAVGKANLVADRLYPTAVSRHVQVNDRCWIQEPESAQLSQKAT